jgi:hypothetical protein
MRSAVGAIAKTRRDLPQRDFWAQLPVGVRIQDEISSRLLCPHVDSTPGIRLIVGFKKSMAPLAIFFLEMYLGAKSQQGIRMVSRMHYPQQHCRSNGEINHQEGRGSSWRHKSDTIHRYEAQGANTIAFLRI